MMDKHYENDWAKAKSRDLVGKMIDETLLTFRKPKDVKVLHFGGIDLTEACQVYLPRGIPAGNIVSIERDKKIAEAQKAQNTGIQVVHSTLEDYLAQQKEINFDVISLDYTGPFSNEHIKIMQELCRNSRNNIVFHSAHSTKRERDNLQSYREGVVLSGSYRVNFEKEGDLAKKCLELLKRAKTSFVDNEHGDSFEERSIGYSTKILSTFHTGFISEEKLDQFLRYCLGREYTSITNEIKNTLKPFRKPVQEEPSLARLACSNIPAQTAIYLHALSVLTARCNDLADHIINSYRSSTTKSIPEDEIRTLITDFPSILTKIMRGDRTFVPLKAFPYTYISESGTPMIGEVYFLSNPFKVSESAYRVARAAGFPRTLQVTSLKEYTQAMMEYNRIAKKWFTNHDEVLEITPDLIHTSRSFLGNASKPVLTKRRFIEELEKGRDIEYVQQHYRGWQNKPLPQWKAHFTMGTYHSQEMNEETAEDSDLEKLTKEQALDLIESKIPVEEIYEAFPTSFTKGQLAAFKAHITMGTYQKENV